MHEANERDRALVERVLLLALKPDAARRHADELVRQYASAAAVIESDPEDLTRLCAVPERAARLLTLIPDLCRGYLRDALGPSPVMDNMTKAGQYVKTLFIGAHYERFYLLSLDANYRLIEHQLVQQGTLSETPFYPRLVVESALRNRAHAVIFAHNHPGGTRSFSVADLNSTQQSMHLLASMGILLLDHLLVAGGEVISLRRKRFYPESEWLACAAERDKAVNWVVYD